MMKEKSYTSVLENFNLHSKWNRKFRSLFWNSKSFRAFEIVIFFASGCQFKVPKSHRHCSIIYPWGWPILYIPILNQRFVIRSRPYHDHFKVKYMSHFSYACKTEGKNGISHLISALCVNCLISIPECSKIIDYSIIWMCIWCGLLQKLHKIKKSELLNSKVSSKL